jgi:hypothetical protein
MPRTFRMRVSLDVKYEKLNLYAKENIQKLFFKNKVGIVKNKSNCIDISVYNKKIPILFPHLGVGCKHKRKIELKDWQNSVINDICLLQGLFHSDGCFYISKQGKYKYERYEFKNNSDDIHNIFRKCCDKLGIKYTIGKLVTRISTKENVEKLFGFIGDKNKIKEIT